MIVWILSTPPRRRVRLRVSHNLGIMVVQFCRLSLLTNVGNGQICPLRNCLAVRLWEPMQRGGGCCRSADGLRRLRAGGTRAQHSSSIPMPLGRERRAT